MKKKPVITVEEVLKKPYVDDRVGKFVISEGSMIPLFGELSVMMLQQFHQLAQKMESMEPIIIFWGLSGKLANYFSVVDDPEMTLEMLSMKLSVAAKDQPYSIYRRPGFRVLVERLGGIQQVTKIPYKDALLVHEGRLKPPNQKEYEEPDDDDVEFDDNCLPACRPGDHKCGK